MSRQAVFPTLPAEGYLRNMPRSFKEILDVSYLCFVSLPFILCYFSLFLHCFTTCQNIRLIHYNINKRHFDVGKKMF